VSADENFQAFLYHGTRWNCTTSFSLRIQEPHSVYRPGLLWVLLLNAKAVVLQDHRCLSPSYLLTIHDHLNISLDATQANSITQELIDLLVQNWIKISSIAKYDAFVKHVAFEAVTLVIMNSVLHSEMLQISFPPFS
jgi:hypothetical protein